MFLFPHLTYLLKLFSYKFCLFFLFPSILKTKLQINMDGKKQVNLIFSFSIYGIQLITFY